MMALLRKNGKLNLRAVATIMGKQVAVHSVYSKRVEVSDGVLQWQRRVQHPRVGWVTGASWLQTGRSMDAPIRYSGSEDEPPDYIRYLRETARRIPVLLVCYWPGTTPVKVPIDGWREPMAGEQPISPQELAWQKMPDREKEETRLYALASLAEAHAVKKEKVDGSKR